MRTARILVVAAALSLALAGCSSAAPAKTGSPSPKPSSSALQAPHPQHTDAGPTVPADDVATAASNTLAARYGYPPTVDCGGLDLVIVKGARFDCVALLNDGLDHDATVTVTSVSGTTFEVSVDVVDDTGLPEPSDTPSDPPQ